MGQMSMPPGKSEDAARQGDDQARERRRQAALDSFAIVDTQAETAYDDIARLAQTLCGTPIALVSLVDHDRQWFKARIGTDLPSIPRDISFCDHAIRTPDEVMVVLDARTDDRFRDNPLVTGDPGIIFYAGAPLVTTDGYAIGTLCVLDNKPRTEFTEIERSILQDLARGVMLEIEVEASRQQIDDLQLINRELQHRMGNMYAQVSGVVSMLGKSESDVAAFMRRLNENIRTMASVQSLFAANHYRAIGFTDLVRSALTPFSAAVDAGRIETNDDHGLIVSERGAFLLTLVLNELATNAVKHGALSNNTGIIRLRTRRDDNITIDWLEDFPNQGMGANPRLGFGSRILREIAPRGLQGSATFELLPTGLSYSLTADPHIFGTAT